MAFSEVLSWPCIPGGVGCIPDIDPGRCGRSSLDRTCDTRRCPYDAGGNDSDVDPLVRVGSEVFGRVLVPVLGTGPSGPGHNLVTGFMPPGLGVPVVAP